MINDVMKVILRVVLGNKINCRLFSKSLFEFYKNRTCTGCLPSHGSIHGDSSPSTNQVDRQLVLENHR